MRKMTKLNGLNVLTTNVGQPNGVASLTSQLRIPMAQLPALKSAEDLKMPIEDTEDESIIGWVGSLQTFINRGKTITYSDEDETYVLKFLICNNMLFACSNSHIDYQIPTAEGPLYCLGSEGWQSTGLTFRRIDENNLVVWDYLHNRYLCVGYSDNTVYLKQSIKGVNWQNTSTQITAPTGILFIFADRLYCALSEQQGGTFRTTLCCASLATEPYNFTPIFYVSVATILRIAISEQMVVFATSNSQKPLCYISADSPNNVQQCTGQISSLAVNQIYEIMLKYFAEQNIWLMACRKELYYSENGINWVKSNFTTYNNSNIWEIISNGEIIVLRDSYYTYWSTDGKVWERCGQLCRFNSMTSSCSLFIGVGDTTNTIQLSNDGKAWRSITVNGNHNQIIANDKGLLGIFDYVSNGHYKLGTSGQNVYLDL